MSKLNARERIAKRIAAELEDGQAVNLGVGIPTLVASFIAEKEVYLQSENGLIGMGPPPEKAAIDADLISAGKEPVTLAKHAAFFNSADSFAMIRGGHIDVAVLGILQVNPQGEVANWAVPGQPILGVGGAMDLVVGAKKVIAAATLFAKDGSAKLVPQLTYPTSGIRLIDMLVTEHAVFEFTTDGVVVTEIVSDMDFATLQSHINVPLKQLKPMSCE